MKFHIEVLNDYKQRGLITSQSHPTLPLLIWNYTRKTEYERLWDEDVTIQTRALVTDLDGNVISKSYRKFFNLGEGRHTPTDQFEITDKLDGQLITTFFWNGEMIVTSRGSFDSKFSNAAKRILKEKYRNFELDCRIEWEYGYQITYCFELVGFEQVVVSYPEPDLILTGAFEYSKNDQCWWDMPIEPNEGQFKHYPPTVKKFDGLDYLNIKSLNWKNKEGFVVRFNNGDRCKIKFDDYLRLHRQMTCISTIGIWQALKDNQPISSMLVDIPDEFFAEIEAYETELKRRYFHIEEVSIAYFNYFKPLLDFSRKEFAEKVYSLLVAPYKWVVLALVDGCDYSEIIWRTIRPKHEKL